MKHNVYSLSSPFSSPPFLPFSPFFSSLFLSFPFSLFLPLFLFPFLFSFSLFFLPFSLFSSFPSFFFPFPLFPLPDFCSPSRFLVSGGAVCPPAPPLATPLNDHMLILLLQTTLKETRTSLAFSVFQSQLQNIKYTIQQPMGHSVDDAIHKRPHLQREYIIESALKMLVLVYFKVRYIIRLYTKRWIL